MIATGQWWSLAGSMYTYLGNIIRLKCVFIQYIYLNYGVNYQCPDKFLRKSTAIVIIVLHKYKIAIITYILFII